MQREEPITVGNFPQPFSCPDQSMRRAASDEDDRKNSVSAQSFKPKGANLVKQPLMRSQVPQRTTDFSRPIDEQAAAIYSMNLADFVKQRFIPGYVAARRSAGQAHFLAILKLILPPDQIPRQWPPNSDSSNVRCRDIEGWPYMNSFRLCDISEERIHHLTSTALESGYSIQTATHIRNVIRAIFSHAIRSCFYNGENPASRVTLPIMTRKEAHTLTLPQLKEIIPLLHYPELGIALFALLTEMNLAEICGLQWKYVNFLDKSQPLDTYRIPPKSVAVRNQTYRGKFEQVMACRKRFVRVPEVLFSMLSDLKSRRPFTSPQDFVLASRAGTPIYPENIAARRLKEIGKAMGVPWLSWSVFHRTHISLKSEFGNNLPLEYEMILPTLRW